MTPRGSGRGEDDILPSAPMRAGAVEAKAAALMGLIETYAEEERTASEVTVQPQFIELRAELQARGSY